MARSALNALRIIAIISIYFLNACGGGSSAGAGGGNGSNFNNVGNVFDSCTVNGNMANFDVKCTKDIRDPGISADGGSLLDHYLGESPDGKRLKFDRTGPKTFKGSASGYPKLEISVNHTDGSTSHIILR